MPGADGEGGGRRISVLVADDSQVLVETLVALLSSHPSLEVVATAVDGAGTMEAVARVEPDVVVMDLRLGDVWGLDLVPALRQRTHPPGIVVYSASSDASTREAVCRAGVAELVTKGAPLQELVTAVVCAADLRPFPQS